MSVIVLPAFHDLKKKSSKGGGFSDGGLHCERLTLSGSVVEVAPPPGVAYAAFNAAGTPFMPTSVQAINFDPDVGVEVEELFVFEDGSTMPTGPKTALAAAAGELTTPKDPLLNANSVKSCSPYLSAGNVLAYPNKLRYKLSLGYLQTALPTRRVLLHFDVTEFDLPKDQG